MLKGMKKLKKCKSILFAVLTVAVMVINGTVANATNVSDLKAKRSQIQSESKKAKDLLNDTKTKKSAALEEVLRLDTDLDEAESELELITSELDKTVIRLGEAEAELSVAREEREKQYESLKKRMRYMYENGSIGYLDVIFDSTDFSDFLNRFEYINRIIEYDDNLVNELAKTESTIYDRVAEIDIKKREQEFLLSQQTEKKHALEEAREQKNIVVIKLTQDEQTVLQQVADLEKSSKEVEEIIKQAEAKAAAARKAAERAAANKATNTASYNGKLGWPVPGRSNVSSGYGYRTKPRKEFHTGIDIPTPTGSNIVSAESGTVISAKYMNGYGYTVMVDHGGGVTTLYGHNSKLVVSAGERIERGQTIAKAGSTGYSTGPHCHFEVRVNGSHIDPWKYLKG